MNVHMGLQIRSNSNIELLSSLKSTLLNWPATFSDQIEGKSCAVSSIYCGGVESMGFCLLLHDFQNFKAWPEGFTCEVLRDRQADG